jgi:hypothetical protein
VPGTKLYILVREFSFLVLEYMMVVWYVIKYRKIGQNMERGEELWLR